MVKLSRLVVNRFRNVRPGTTLRFTSGLNVVLGRNGSGKSTLLDLVAAVLSMDFSPFSGEPLDLEFDARYDGDEVQAHTVNELSAEGTLQRRVRLKLKPGADEADALRVNVTDTTMTIERSGTVIYEGPASFEPTRRPGLATLLDLVRQVASRGTLNQTRTLIAAARLARIKRFGEGIESLGYAVGDGAEIYALPSEGTGPVGLSFAVPDWVIDAVALKLATGAELPFRIDARDASAFAPVLPCLGARSVEVVVEHVRDEGNGAQRYRCSRLLIDQSGTVIDYDRLSWGQQRLLALFWYFTSSPHALVVDALPNGLDHAWVDLCLQQVGQRQTFLSASTPTLLEHIRFDSGEDVRKALTTCHAGEINGRSELVWDQPQDKAAAAFYRAWKGGPGPLGELIRSKELW